MKNATKTLITMEELDLNTYLLVGEVEIIVKTKK